MLARDLGYSGRQLAETFSYTSGDCHVMINLRCRLEHAADCALLICLSLIDAMQCLGLDSSCNTSVSPEEPVLRRHEGHGQVLGSHGYSPVQPWRTVEAIVSCFTHFATTLDVW